MKAAVNTERLALIRELLSMNEIERRSPSLGNALRRMEAGDADAPNIDYIFRYYGGPIARLYHDIDMETAPPASLTA